MSLVKDIGSYVTHYSEEVKQRAKHLDQVRIAGKITQIRFPLMESKDDYLLSCYVFEVDDDVGSLMVYVSPMMFNHYREILHKDNVVMFEGYVNVVTRELKGTIQRECSIVAYRAELIRGETHA
jgi:hypothetical protein